MRAYVALLLLVFCFWSEFLGLFGSVWAWILECFWSFLLVSLFDTLAASLLHDVTTRMTDFLYDSLITPDTGKN